MKRLVLGVWMGLVGACSAPSGATDTASNEIINGEEANSASDDAVGALLMDQADGTFTSFCTATLVADDRVLTAKHCAAQKRSGGGWDYTIGHHKLVFAIGPDGKHPKRSVPIESVIITSIDEGGWDALGSDVAVYRLAEKVTDIRPMSIAKRELRTSDEGKAFRAIGYGSQDQAETLFGTRKAGRVTLRAASGKMFHKMFGSLEAFESAVAAHTSQGYVEGTKAALAEMYDRELLAEYEAWVGESTSDAQTCHGDSGGPLLGEEDGEVRIWGVVSGGVTPLFSTGCILGTAYATFGPHTRELVNDEVHGKAPDGGLESNGERIDGATE